MKKYIVDRLLFLMVGIGIIIYIWFYQIPVFTFIFGFMAVLSWVGLCWRILILPLDLVHGKVEKTVYFSSQSQIQEYESFRRYCFVWNFHYGSNQKISLLVPVSIKKEELDLIEYPKKNVPIKVTYYRYSKILIHWEEQSGINTENGFVC